MIPALSGLLDQGVANQVFPAAQAAVWLDGRWVHRSTHGQLAGRPTEPGDLFDIASVTKLVCTTLAIACLVDDGAIELDDPVSRYLPLFARNGKRYISVRQLLGHSSGLPAWRPFFTEALRDPVASSVYPSAVDELRVSRAIGFERARELVLTAALIEPQEAPPGNRVYSDLGFIALGELVSAVSGLDLDAFFAERITAPLGLTQTRYFDLRAPVFSQQAIACTGRTRPREPAPGQEELFRVPPQAPALVPGEVDDDNAWALHGIAGHAGLFSTADEVNRVGQALLADLGGAERLLRADTVRAFMAPDTGVSGPLRSLGFDRIAPVGSSAGSRLGQGARGGLGHLGFTGCSLWLDLDRGLVVSLLTNRTLFGREHGARIRAFRPRFHDLVAEWVDEDDLAPTDVGDRA